VSWCTLETSGNVLQALHQTPKAIQNTSFDDPAPPEERPHAHWQLRRRSFKTSSPLTLKDTLFIARSPTKATFDGQVAAQHGRSGMREAITINCLFSHFLHFWSRFSPETNACGLRSTRFLFFCFV